MSLPKPKKIIDKVISRTDAIGALFGFFAKFGYSIDDMSFQFQELTSKPRATNFTNVMNETLNEAVKPMIMPIVVGELMKYMDVYPKYGGLLSKFGMGYVGGTVVGSIIRNSHNPGGLGGTQTGTSTAGRVSESITGRASYPMAATSTFGRAAS